MKMKQTYFNCYFTFFSGAPAAGIIPFYNYGKLPYFYGLNFYPLFYGIFPATMMIKIKEF